MPTFIARAGGSGAEPDAVLRRVRRDVEHLRDVDQRRPVLGLEVVPAAVLERAAQPGERLLGEARRQRHGALEPDGHAAGLGHRQWLPSAGWTISVSTPPVA